jgi:hypothetical protein
VIRQPILHTVSQIALSCLTASIVFSVAFLLSSIVLQPAGASQKSHSGVQRYGDVIIVRHADGTIESRDAGGPTRSDGTGPSSHRASVARHHRTGTTYSGPVKTKKTSTNPVKKSAVIAKAAPGTGKVPRPGKKQHLGHHASSSGGDDVVIIRNTDGSVEARDAQ